MTAAQHTKELDKLSGLNGILAWAYALACIIYKTRFPLGPEPQLDTTHRTGTEQNKLYAQGRTQPGPIITNAVAGKSKHNVYPSKAFDVKFIGRAGDADWAELHFERFAAIMKEVEPTVTWGGTFKTLQDRPHFEI